MSIPSSRGSFPYIVFSVASQPSTCMSKGNHWDACPIKTLQEEVKRAVSCEVIVQVSFPHKCGQLSWCRALNVEVMATFPDIFLFRCLHDWCPPSCFTFWSRELGKVIPRCICFSGSSDDGLACLLSSDLLF